MWHWEQVDATRSGSSGDISKLFKNEEVKEPGVFAAERIHPDATLMAREVLQNSWDAARELHESLNDQEIPEFGIRFEFRDLIGEEKERFVGRMGLRELHDRATDDSRRRAQLGLSAANSLDRLDDDSPLQVLVISERATTGMYGPWGAKSKLYLALVSLGFTQKASGSGGSYGYGKAGLIRGSATRTVVAYTCFREQPAEPGVTRRLLGMTYWGPHDLPGDPEHTYTGFARFGHDVGDGTVVPFEDDAADQVAGQFELELRQAGAIDDLGTTFVLVEPTVDPAELRAAIERNWWPAIEDEQFTVEVVTTSGEVLHPRPRKNDILNTFVQSWKVATVPQDNTVPTEMRRIFNRVGSRKLGNLGLIADPDSWSYPQMIPNDNGSDPGSLQHRSLIALVRGPRMVVEYYEAGQAPPFVRGTFVADHDVDDLLRQTEPKAHDSWQTKESIDGIDPDAPEVAAAILSRVRTAVSDFRKALKPPTPRPQDIRLPVLEDLFKHLIDANGTTNPRPDPAPRNVNIHVLEQAVETAPEAPTKIRLRARVGFSLSDRYRGDVAEVELGLHFAFVEDGSAGERCALIVHPATGFVPTGDEGELFIGSLGHEQVEFTAVSAPYDPDWSGRLTAVGDLLGQLPDEEVGP